MDIEEKLFVTEDNKATFICPRCEKKRTIDVSEYKDSKKAVRIKRQCSCGHEQVVLLERRYYYRKEVSLPGVYSIENEDVKKAMTVKDLSRSGMKIEVDDTSVFKQGDRLVVEFCLDDSHETLIRKTVVIKKITPNTIGAQFAKGSTGSSIEKIYDTVIGFYTFTK